MSDYTNKVGNVQIREGRFQAVTDWQDAFAFLATGVGYAANLAALILLAARFIKPGPADSAAAWRLIGSFCLAALIIGVFLLLRRQGSRIGIVHINKEECFCRDIPCPSDRGKLQANCK